MLMDGGGKVKGNTASTGNFLPRKANMDIKAQFSSTPAEALLMPHATPQLLPTVSSTTTAGCMLSVHGLTQHDSPGSFICGLSKRGQSLQHVAGHRVRQVFNSAKASAEAAMLGNDTLCAR